ncbi:spore coat U domain-containing protein [Novosphingobium sp. JCM 18896]|uniref:Csu type fimbrial protein n=1 Tax=Novosphingobium sp. JCM 18896 TaxID=2989731 RepID=UPI002222E1AB|nr:spore coat U domain-containing protein [Novosphingobium sp. JCM 18896]MCW1430818.1 spore coat U domain-containing protein [Novosphingobium sp. JCM 18896]
MRKLFLVAASASALFAAPAFAQDTGTLDVSAEVPESCEITGATLDFGEVRRDEVLASGDVALVCTSGAEFTLTADGGTNASSGQRRLVTGSGPNATYLAYNLFTDSGRLAELTDEDGIEGTADETTGEATVTIYGQIPAAADGVARVAAEDYTDSVEISVSF